jgi:hypothetical protein
LNARYVSVWRRRGIVAGLGFRSTFTQFHFRLFLLVRALSTVSLCARFLSFSSPFLLASLPSRVPSFSSHFVLVSLRSRTSLILATRGAAYASPSCSLRCCGSSPSCSHFRVLCCYTAPTRSAWRAWLAADPSAAVASSDGPAFRRSPKHPLLTNAAQGDLCRCAHDLLTPCNRFPPPHSLPLPFHLHFSIVTPAGSAARVHPCNPH